MADSEWYKDWFNSPYYHKLYFNRDEEEAENFMSQLLSFLKPPAGSRMLDVACGKGRHSKFLAEHGFNVTGIDISPDSIQFAKQYENENLSFYVHDMRLLSWINYFQYVFNFFTSFGYFATRREHDAAMRTMAGGLQKNGTVVIDYLNVHYVEDRMVFNEEKHVDGTNYEIHRWHDEYHFFKKITVTDAALTEPMHHTEKVSKFSLGDFTDMLSYHNLQITDVFGDYQLNPYHIRNTPRMIIVAKKF